MTMVGLTRGAPKRGTVTVRSVVLGSVVVIRQHWCGGDGEQGHGADSDGPVSVGPMLISSVIIRLVMISSAMVGSAMWAQ